MCIMTMLDLMFISLILIIVIDIIIRTSKYWDRIEQESNNIVPMKEKMIKFLNIKYSNTPIWKAYLREIRIQKKNNNYLYMVNPGASQPLYVKFFKNEKCLSEYNRIINQ